jgi:hypothetical protein
MKRFAWCAVTATASALLSCGGVTKEQMDTMKAELLANDATQAAKLKSELTGVDQKYVTVQQLQLRVEKQLDDMAKLLKELQGVRGELTASVNLANTNVVKSLEFEEKLMSDRLAQLRLMIEELKKKPGQ